MSHEFTETYKLDKLSRNEFVTEMYKRYGRKLYAYALRSWSLNEDAAWDIIYKTLFKVHDSYKKYSFVNEDKFASFVFRIFINYLRNHYRDNRAENERKFDPVDEMDISGESGDEAPAGTNVKLTALNEELEKMEDWQRMLLLTRSEGMAYSEIAKFIDKPEGQLKVYYQRLKEKITKKLN